MRVSHFEDVELSYKKPMNRKGRKGREGIQGLEQLDLFA